MRKDLKVPSLQSVAAALAERPYARRGISPATEPISVVLVDDHGLFRAGVRVLLGSVTDIRVVGDSDATADLPALVMRLRPQVVVLDLNMPTVDGLNVTRQLVSMSQPPRVLILSMNSEEESLIPSLEAGASGFLTKEAAESDLTDAIRVVASGDTYVRPRVARMLAAKARERAQQARAPRSAATQAMDSLSAREKSVVELTARGYGGVEIGEQLGISNKTVETYKQRIEEKVGLRHRSDYVRFALEIGVLHI